MQLKTGNLSYFQTNYGFYHSGRIFNALYRPLFAYLNGLLLLICKSWFIYQIVVDYLVLLTAGRGMYQLCRKVKVNQLFAISLASIYLQFGITISILRFNWMAWGAALAPAVMMQAVNLVEDREQPIHCLSLALIMALVAQIHLLSTVILAVTLIPFFLYALWKSKAKKELLFSLLKAVVLTFLLTANIWGAFLLLYPNNQIALPNSFNLEHYALHLSKYASLHAHVSYTIAGLILLQVLYVIFNFKESKMNTIATIVALMILIVSSRYFPWARIQSLYPRLGAAFQFSYRLTLGAYPLMFLGSGISLTKLFKKRA